MPMYEYRCGSCGHAFERYSAGKCGDDVAGVCEKCGKATVKKVFSTFASASCCSGSGSVSSSSSGGCSGGNSSFS